MQLLTAFCLMLSRLTSWAISLKDQNTASFKNNHTAMRLSIKNSHTATQRVSIQFDRQFSNSIFFHDPIVQFISYSSDVLIYVLNAINQPLRLPFNRTCSKLFARRHHGRGRVRGRPDVKTDLWRQSRRDWTFPVRSTSDVNGRWKNGARTDEEHVDYFRYAGDL